jgi:UDP-N-acetylmuramoyl-L-alanyl-D-glutamate--2,6-diaminopimelate ligase
MNTTERSASTASWLAAIKLAPSAQLASDSRRIKAGDVFFAYPGDSRRWPRYH